MNYRNGIFLVYLPAIIYGLSDLGAHKEKNFTDEATGDSEWAVIPYGAYLGHQADTTIPVEVGLYYESFTTENHRLNAMRVAENQEDLQSQWICKIELPPELRTGRFQRAKSFTSDFKRCTE